MTNDFLELSDKKLLIFGVANKKSVAFHVGKTLQDIGAKVIYVVRSDERRQAAAKLLEDAEIHVCDVEFDDQIARLRDELAGRGHRFAGMLHSIAFADSE